MEGDRLKLAPPPVPPFTSPRQQHEEKEEKRREPRPDEKKKEWSQQEIEALPSCWRGEIAAPDAPAVASAAQGEENEEEQEQNEQQQEQQEGSDAEEEEEQEQEEEENQRFGPPLKHQRCGWCYWRGWDDAMSFCKEKREEAYNQGFLWGAAAAVAVGELTVVDGVDRGSSPAVGGEVRASA